MPREDEDYLADMRVYARRAVALAQRLSFIGFSGSLLYQYALFMAIATVGEAAAQVSDGARQTNPSIPWADIIGMRNRLVHAYYEIDLDIVWRTIHDDLPPLIAQLEPLLPEQPA